MRIVILITKTIAKEVKKHYDDVLEDEDCNCNSQSYCQRSLKYLEDEEEVGRAAVLGLQVLQLHLDAQQLLPGTEIVIMPS